jgi:hypothetical protein
VLARAVHRSKRQIEELVAELAPVADVPFSVLRLPQRPAADPVAFPPVAVSPNVELGPDRAAAAVPVPLRTALIQPVAPSRYRVQFTASGEFQAKLGRLRDLMRTAVPDGDLAAILEIAVTEKLARLEARRFARTPAPRKGTDDTHVAASGSRYVAAAVRRAVYERDGGRCRYVTGDGRRCTARHDLEFHHHHAHARGGDRSVVNLRLMCADP